MTGTDFDDVLKKFSIFGRYHCLFLFLTILAFASNSVYSSNYIFTAEEVAYKCADEAFGDNACYMKNIENATVRCTEWIYENPNTFVAEFQLACQEWKRTLVGTVHSFGYMVGLLVVGPLSDRLGRKLTLVITGILGGVFGILKSFTPWYWIYIVLEFLEAAIGDNCSPMFILTIEIVPTKKRALFYILCCFGYTLGGILLPAAAWLVPYWRNFLRVIYSPALFFFLYLYFMDESPRWLLTKGKKDEAVAILQKAANMNKIKLEKSTLEKITCEETKGISFLNLLKITFSSKTLTKRCLICIVWWTTSTFVNFGMTINSVSLQGNKYINYMIVQGVDVIGNLMIIYVLKHFKRKMPLIASFMIGAVLCVSQPFVPTSLLWLSITFYMAGKLMSSFYFNITYMYTSELFPTYTRNSMHALCSSMGRIGSMLAPQTPLLMHYWTGLPPVIFGGSSLLAGLLTFLVPDTGDNDLPNTVKQAEALGKTDKERAMEGEVNYAFSKEDTGPNLVVNREGKVSRL
ncbi:solute carrier family 22 member 3-like [Ostrinia nubilalis]|uniref:solute carrier family 22 member 3-like n=1 Tax=Ostrinia nubilalis TaxID=29057 RepID=UPI0030825D26